MSGAIDQFETILKEELNKLKAVVKGSEAEAATAKGAMEAQLINLRTQISELEAQKGKLVKEVTGAKDLNRVLKGEVNKLREEMEQQRTRFEAQGTELNIQKEYNAKLNGELSKQRTLFEGQIKELRDEVTEMTNQEFTLKTRVTDFQQEISQMTANIQFFEDQIDTLANDLMTQTDRSDDRKTVLEAQKASISKLTKANREGKKTLRGTEKALKKEKNAYAYLMNYVKERLAEIEKVEEKKKEELDKMLKDLIAKLKKERAEYEEQIKAKEEMKKKEEEDKKRKFEEKEKMGAKKRKLE